jgi:O-acetyl-ADP-ribose deacetylase (regulator of RNase III)/uncharacterized protein YwgA
MVIVKVGDLFNSDAQTLVNTVNCVGVMGKGVALEFKNRFPSMFEDYVRRCAAGEVQLGKPYLYSSLMPPWILNFPTKDHWRSVSNLGAIVKGLEYFLDHYIEWGITSIAFPPLGCGNGQLEWRIVGPTLYKHLNQLSIPVELFAPYGTPHEELQLEFLDQQLQRPVMPTPEWVKPAWVALAEIVENGSQHIYSWPIGHTTFQKIAYKATREGLPTHLRFGKGSYGPFSPDTKAITSKLVNNELITEQSKGNMIQIRPGPTLKDAKKAYEQYLCKWRAAMDRISDLFLRVNTNQAEITATVIYSADELATINKQIPTESELLKYVMKWKQRQRPPLQQTEVALAIRDLARYDGLMLKT